MATRQYNLSLDTALIERFHALIPKGDRTSEISKLISEYCDKLEATQDLHKIRKLKFEKYYKPFIRKYANGKDPFYLLENKGLRTAFSEAEISITEEDIKLCIEQLLKEGEE